MTSDSNHAAIDSVFRLVDREIWVITAAAGDSRGGLIATWVSQVSLAAENPVVLIGLAPNHFTSELIDSSGCFAMHLFAGDQARIALPFALGSGRDHDKLAGVEHFQASTGAPILTDCLAWLDCRVFHRMPTGDRTFYWAEVIEGKRNRDDSALRESQLIAACTPDELTALKENRVADIDSLEPGRMKWRRSL